MIAQAPANLARLLDGVVSRDARVAASGDKKRCKNAEECGLASAVGAENRQRLSFLNFKRHSGQCHGRGLFKWLEKSAPTAARGGNGFARASTVIAASGTRNLIACLGFEDNRDSASVCAR